VGWAIAHLRRLWPGWDGEDDLAEIDEVLLDHLDQSPGRGDYDLIEGLVGFGVSALERLPRPAAITCLERVVDRLAAMAEPQGGGTTWWTDPAWLPAETRAEYPRGYYNLGLAHGVPGVIGLLGQVCAAGVLQDKARPLLDGAVHWLLEQDGLDGFGYWVGPGARRDKARRPGVTATRALPRRCSRRPATSRSRIGKPRRGRSPAAPPSGRTRMRASRTPRCAMDVPAWATCSTGCSRPRASPNWPRPRGPGSSGR
jgi:hypothetical protein